MICHQPVQMPGQMMYSNVRLFTIPKDVFVYIYHVAEWQWHSSTLHAVHRLRKRESEKECVTRDECLQPSFICTYTLHFTALHYTTTFSMCIYFANVATRLSWFSIVLFRCAVFAPYFLRISVCTVSLSFIHIVIVVVVFMLFHTLTQCKSHCDDCQ